MSASYAAPIAMTGAGSYTQNFDTLPTSGTTNPWVDDTTISGWYAQRSGSGTTIIADIGTGNAGALYSYGAASATERALGTLGSSNAAAGSFAHGIQLQNTSGGSVTINLLGYTGEQWRKSGVTAAQVVTLWYKVSASPITALEPTTDAGWTAVPTGDFSSPINTATAAALNGNDVANRVSISINPIINIPTQSYVMLRWKDPDHAGSDHGLAIDDVSVAWVAVATPAITLSATPTNFLENAGAAASTGTVSIPAALATDLVIDLLSNDLTEATAPATVKILAGETTATFPINAVNDLLADGTQNVSITASAAGYLGGQTSLTVDNDTDGAITVTVTPTSFSEGAATGTVSGTVALAEVTPVDVMVSLTSSNILEATVPESVTIPAGQNSVAFAVTAVQDTVLDGDKSVRIDATSAEYTPGRTFVTVTDDEVPTPPTLTAGAIAFVGFNADLDDDLAFVALTPIPANETIFFTDNEWNGSEIGAAGAFNTGEAVLAWTAPVTGVAAGTIVTLDSLKLGTRKASVGALIASGNVDLSGTAETVYAYQGAAATTPAVFLAVIANHAADSTANTGLSTNQIIILPAGSDVAAYTGSRTNKPTFAGYLDALVDVINWITEDATGEQNANGIAPDVPFDTTAFVLGSAPSGYGTWAKDHAGNGAPNEDFDGDGMKNGVEYFMGAADGFTANPAPLGNKVSWPHSATATGASFKVFRSDDLGTWIDVTADATDVDGKVDYVLPTTATKQFVRLEVTIAP